MLERRCGRVVDVSSGIVATRAAMVGANAYAATRAALWRPTLSPRRRPSRTGFTERHATGSLARSEASAAVLTRHLDGVGARHILMPPRTPRWNGKIERFFGTLDRECAHGRVWPNSTRRDRVLSSFLRFYNRRRPHSPCGGRPLITRVHQLREQDN